MHRQPRPQGATFLSLKYQYSGTKEDQQALINHLVNLYTIDGFRWNGKPISIPNLSAILKVPQHEIMDQVSRTGTQMGSLASPENIKNTIETIVTIGTTNALQDRGFIFQQLNQLLQSQDGKYKPFITAEVNKTLKLLLESNKKILETYKTFFTSTNNTTNILNIIADSKDNEKDYITPDKALELITNNGLPYQETKALTANPNPHTPSETSSLADKLFEEYGIGDLQDVRESRTGTEALMALEPLSREATKPASQPAEPNDSQEDGGFGRRGIEVEDTDELS